MKIATFNANSIRVRIPIVLEWLEREKPEILCLQETKAQDKDFPSDDFEKAGYQSVIRGQKSYNGVAILTTLPFENEIRKNLYEVGDEQARFVSVRMEQVDVINVYVPQGFSPGTDKFEYKLKWLEDLLFHIDRHYEPVQPIIVTGDFNVALTPNDVYDPEGFRGDVGFHPDEQTRLQKILDWGFVDVFRLHHPEGEHYTFWDYRIPNAFKRKMGWRIDYILATRSLADKCRDAWIDTLPRTLKKPSDHTFLMAEFDNLDWSLKTHTF
jgi:exodeoxyribonuclease-3